MVDVSTESYSHNFSRNNIEKKDFLKKHTQSKHTGNKVKVGGGESISPSHLIFSFFLTKTYAPSNSHVAGRQESIDFVISRD